MHSAKIPPNLFDVQIAGKQGSISELFPGWDAHDRFGIVINEAFGGIGASLLIQAAITSFYAAEPTRAGKLAQYPQIYAFHVAERHGDMSTFDFWPPRHEVFITSDAYELLGAINDRAITRLAIPDVTSASDDYVEAAPSGWTDRWCATERIRSVFAYSPNGDVGQPDVVIEGRHPRLLEMASSALAPEKTAEMVASWSDQEVLAMEVGPTSVADMRQYLEIFRTRICEVDAKAARRKADQREQQIARNGMKETYRRVHDNLFGMLGAVAGGV